MTLAQDLTAYSLDALRVMARTQGIADAERLAKAPLVHALAERMTRPDAVRRSLEALPPHHRATVERLQHRGGAWTTTALGLDLARIGVLDEPGHYLARNASPDRPTSRRLEDVLAYLAARGLVLTRTVAASRTGSWGLETPGGTAHIPGEVLRHLPPPTPIGPPAEVPTVLQSDVLTTLRDALLYWSYAEHNEVQIISRGTVAKRHFVRISQSLLVPEEAEKAQTEDSLGRTYFLRLILEKAGVLEIGGDLILRPSRGARAFFGQSEWSQASALYRLWLTGRWWDELDRLFRPVGSYGGPASQALVAGRATIALLVGDLAADQWVGLDEFVDRVRRDRRDFLIARTTRQGRVENPYAAQSQNPFGVWFGYSPPDEVTGWELVEARLIVHFLLAMHWLGLISLGYDGDRLISFRLSADGRALVRGEAPPPRQPEPSLVVQASFQTIAYQHAPTSLLAALETLAERVQAGPVFEYRLTRESAYRARQRGFSTARILELLEENSTTPIPQNVRQSLLDWEREHGRILFSFGVNVLHALEPGRLDALAADPKVAPALGRRLDPHMVALRPKTSVRKLIGTLATKGELLAVDRPDEPQPARLGVRTDGRIDFGGRLPSLALRRQVAAFADEREGFYWITDASLRRGAEAGLKADDVLAVLRMYCREPLPAAVERAIRAGARHWGTVKLSEVALVRVESAEILDQMLAEPSLRGLLRRLDHQSTIAVARLEDAAKVRDALEALGVDAGREPPGASATKSGSGASGRGRQ